MARAIAKEISAIKIKFLALMDIVLTASKIKLDQLMAPAVFKSYRNLIRTVISSRLK